MQKVNNLFTEISKKKNTESGLLVLLACIVINFYKPNHGIEKLMLIITLLTLLLPVVFSPFTYYWSGIVKILAAINSIIVLAVLFILVVIPVGIIRKWMGIDNLKLRQFKKGNETVFKERNHLYKAVDIKHSF
jgi:prepilin signal peptidase PulO-like enzyme (type II secretory pathway)